MSAAEGHDTGGARPCPACGRESAAGFPHCPWCGADKRPSARDLEEACGRGLEGAERASALHRIAAMERRLDELDGELGSLMEGPASADTKAGESARRR